MDATDISGQIDQDFGCERQSAPLTIFEEDPDGLAGNAYLIER
jgi:hypothetical protein